MIPTYCEWHNAVYLPYRDVPVQILIRLSPSQTRIFHSHHPKPVNCGEKKSDRLCGTSSPPFPSSSLVENRERQTENGHQTTDGGKQRDSEETSGPQQGVAQCSSAFALACAIVFGTGWLAGWGLE